MSRHSRSRTRRRNRGRFGPLFKLLCVAAVGVALTVGVTVFFQVESVTVTGNQRYTDEEIIQASGIQVGDNLYAMNKTRIDQNIRTSLPYIGNLTIDRVLPNKVAITVTEWEAVAKIAAPDQAQAAAVREELMGNSKEAEPVRLAEGPWLISVKGKLLEPAPEDSGAITVTGLTAVEPEAGRMLEVPGSEQTRMSALTSLLEALEQEQATGGVSAIRLENTQLVLRYLDRFDVKMRLNADFSYDVRMMEAVREQIEEKYSVEAAGSIDLTQERYGAVYSPAQR